MTNEPILRTGPSGAGAELLRRIAVVFGPLSRPLAGRRWFRLWGVLHHVGRTSGRPYATPIVARRVTDGFVIPLPFGERTQWLRNLQAAGAGTIRWDGRDYGFVDPRVVDLADVTDAFSGAQQAALRRAGARCVRVVDAPAPRG
jgi:deazaflavin-dependent oxidoreductase (nitroreductase family)